jgi:hypothetical protein
VILDKTWESHPKRPSVEHYFSKGVPPSDFVIRADIPRTMPHVAMFSQANVRESLYRVLRAYSNADPELGYYQGMAFPAALLLAYMPETQAFWAFHHLMSGKGHMLRTLYVHEFKNMGAVNNAWETLLQSRYKAVAANLRKLDIQPIIYTPQWFLTGFLTINFPTVFRLRSFDRIAAFGTRAILSLGLAVVGVLEVELQRPSMEEVIILLQNPHEAPQVQDWRALIAKWDKVFLSKADFKKLFKKVGITEFS